MTVIYAMYDPRAQGIVRYVGKTNGPFSVRLKDHLQRSRAGRSHRDCWIRSLTRDGVTPIFQVLEVILEGDWQSRERHWIAHYAGEDLTNGTAGGDGLHRPTKETRDRMRASHLGKKLSPETCAKLSAVRKGKRPTEETRALLRATNGPRAIALAVLNNGSKRPQISAGLKKAWAEGRMKPLPKGVYKRSEAQRIRHSAALRASVTPEFRARMSEIRKRIESERRAAKGLSA